MTYSKPRWSRCLDDRIFSRWILSNSMQPRMPFGRSLRSVEIILRIIDPSLSSFPSAFLLRVRLTRDFFSWVHVFKVSISKFIRSDMTTEFSVSDIPSPSALTRSLSGRIDSRHLPEPFFEAYSLKVPYRSD
jgi:hypothetical protein